MSLSEHPNLEYVDFIGSNVMVYAQALGSFTRRQAYLMIPQRSNKSVDELLFLMQKANMIYRDPINENHFTSSPYVPYDEASVKALWPVLIHKGDILPEVDSGFWIGKGKYPAAVSYLLDGKFYDVMPLTDENKAILIYVDREYELEKDANCGEHKYIFLIENESVINNLPKVKAPHYFVLVDENDEDEPVKFIKDEE